jgi:CHASE2 domain-containing sensor protein
MGIGGWEVVVLLALLVLAIAVVIVAVALLRRVRRGFTDGWRHGREDAPHDSEHHADGR